MSAPLIDIEKIRAETPGVSSVNHLAAAGAGLMPQCVVEAIVDHTLLEARIGGYEAHARQAEMLDGVYDDVANLIGAKRNEIALLENATVAWCQAFYALPLKKGDRVLTCHAEYAANYVAFLQRQQRDGIVIDVVPNDETGAIDVTALENMLDDKVKLIAITWIPTNGGLVNPAVKIGEIAKKYSINYLLDACQAVGQMPVDVDELHCDFLSATGRKFLRGPRGTGFLYVREKWLETLEPAMIDHFGAEWTGPDRYQLRDDARRFENWENAYALRAGLGAAVRYAVDLGLANIQQRAWGLAGLLRAQLGAMIGAQVCDAGSEHCAIVSFTIDGLDPRETVQALRAKGINIGASDPSSTLLDSNARDLPVLLRASLHYYNTEDEIDQLIKALDELR